MLPFEFMYFIFHDKHHVSIRTILPNIINYDIKSVTYLSRSLFLSHFTSQMATFHVWPQASRLLPFIFCLLNSKMYCLQCHTEKKNGECTPVSQILGLKVTCIICTNIMFTFPGTSHRPYLT